MSWCQCQTQTSNARPQTSNARPACRASNADLVGLRPAMPCDSSQAESTRLCCDDPSSPQASASVWARVRVGTEVNLTTDSEKGDSLMASTEATGADNADVSKSADNRAIAPDISRKQLGVSKRAGSIIDRSTARFSRRHLTIGAKGLHGASDCYQSQR